MVNRDSNSQQQIHFPASKQIGVGDGSRLRAVRCEQIIVLTMNAIPIMAKQFDGWVEKWKQFVGKGCFQDRTVA